MMAITPKNSRPENSVGQNERTIGFRFGRRCRDVITAALIWVCIYSCNSGHSPSSDKVSIDDSHERIWGVTIDAIDSLPEIVASLEAMARRPTARIVFDEYVPASEYVQAVAEIHRVSDVMGEILDSMYVAEYSVAEYEERTRSYLQTLAATVDIWEIGNEINGEWLGTTETVVAKMSAAYRLVKAAGGATALTLYYNEACWENADHEMFVWARDNLPQELKEGLDYVFVSYYEDDCNDLQPDWLDVFSRLADMFPEARIGIGECGTEDTGRKADYILRYYTMDLDINRFLGGFFWWYYKQDMVPNTKPLWQILNDIIAEY